MGYSSWKSNIEHNEATDKIYQEITFTTDDKLKYQVMEDIASALTFCDDVNSYGRDGMQVPTTLRDALKLDVENDIDEILIKYDREINPKNYARVAKDDLQIIRTALVENINLTIDAYLQKITDRFETYKKR